jgi:hypothetical protein
MRAEVYAAARTISPELHSYFACQREKALERADQSLAPLPDAGTVEAIIDAAFWASLRREEGYPPRISLAYLPPEQAGDPILFESPLPLAAGALTRLAPAVERPGIHLGVWRERGELCLWGATRGIPLLCFVLEVAAPGLLVVKHYNGGETRKFINVAVLEGDEIKLIEQPPSGRPEPPPVLRSLLRLDTPDQGKGPAATALQLAVSMREHGRGGSLLIVPSGSNSWRNSILQPIPYAVSPAFQGLAAFSQDGSAEPETAGWQEKARPEIAAIGGLTAVDGAVILNSRFELLGFGAKIVRAMVSSPVEQVYLTEPIRGVRPSRVHAGELGGTRHLSAAQFVHDQRDAVALVASQDGRFTVFEWSAAEGTVRAHRIETLLL